MVEAARTCPACGRTLGPQASRCFYCGQVLPATNPFDPAPGAPAPLPAAALPGSPLESASLPQADIPSSPNTLCPICRSNIVAEARPDFVCPSCQGNLECLFAAGPARAKAPVPVAAPRSTISEICTFHPGVQAAGRCKNCRKAVCETCAFRVRVGLYCPDCASTPDEEGRKGSTTRGVVSLVCGSAALIMVVVTFVAAAAAEGESDSEKKKVGCLFFVTLILAIVGMATGFMSRDPARGRSVVGLIGLIISFLVIALFALAFVSSLVLGK